MEGEPTIRPDQLRPVVVLVVPGGGRSPDALAAAVRRFHPELDVVAVWAGDPHLHPPLGSTVGSMVEWRPVVGAERVLATAEPDAAWWSIAARTSLDLLDAGRPTRHRDGKLIAMTGIRAQIGRMLRGRAHTIGVLDDLSIALRGLQQQVACLETAPHARQQRQDEIGAQQVHEINRLRVAVAVATDDLTARVEATQAQSRGSA